MAANVRIDGLRELEKALADLPKATGRNVLRSELRETGRPVAETARALAPVGDGGDLRDSIAVSTKLSSRQRRLQRKLFEKGDVEIYVGAGPTPAAHTQEFGTINHGPQPFMRPAWDAHKGGMLGGLGKRLWARLDKAAKRLARKQARLAAKG